MDFSSYTIVITAIAKFGCEYVSKIAPNICIGYPHQTSRAEVIVNRLNAPLVGHSKK